jgi:PAS domain S-box-containing protein
MRIVSVSDNVSNYGYADSDIISGKINIISLVGSDEYSRILSRINAEISAKSKRFSEQFRMFDSSGKSHWMESHNLVKYDANNGQAKYINGVVIDITDRKSIENDLLQKTKELEDINKMMTGREIKMIELKQTIRRLQDELSDLKQNDELHLSDRSLHVNDANETKK